MFGPGDGLRLHLLEKSVLSGAAGQKTYVGWVEFGLVIFHMRDGALLTAGLCHRQC